jgi:hypothetical protein
MNNKSVFIVTLAVIVLALAPLANQDSLPPLARARVVEPLCHLTVRSDPSSGSIHFGESIGAKISGKLTCRPDTSKEVGGLFGLLSKWARPDFYPLGGATIDLNGLSPGMKAITDSSGNYHEDILVGPQTYTVKANYAGDRDHNEASATTTMHFTVK